MSDRNYFQNPRGNFTADELLYRAELSKWDDANQNRRPLTEYAKRYGETEEAGLRSSGKSGLSPIIRSLGQIPESQEEYDREKLIKNYQIDKLWFTSQELKDWVAIEKEDAKQPDLLPTFFERMHDGVSPPFRFENWNFPSRGSRVQIPNTIQFLDRGESDVWFAMLPSLQLASRIIQNSHTSPFFDALMNGERRDIDPTRIPPDYDGDTLRSFHSRPQELRTADSAVTDWARLSRNLAFAITNDRAMLDRTKHTYTEFTEGDGITLIEISYRLILPLMSKKLTPSERLVHVFFLTVTILHSITHAFLQQNAVHDVFDFSELLYFEDELVAEVGYSMENALFGGQVNITKPLSNRDGGRVKFYFPPPFLWIGMSEFPNFHDMWKQRIYGDSDLGLSLLTPELQDVLGFGEVKRDTWPITLNYLDDICQKSFWDVSVAKWGAEILKDDSNIFKYRFNESYDANGELMYPHGLPNQWVVTESRAGYLGDDLQPDSWERIKYKRARESRAVAYALAQRRRDEWRAHKAYVDPTVILPYWEIAPSRPLAEILEEIAIEQNIDPADIRHKGPDFIKRHVTDYLRHRNKLPTNQYDQEIDAQIIAGSIAIGPREQQGLPPPPPLQRMLGYVRAEENAANRPIQDVNALVELVRNYLGNNGYPRDFYDAEMNQIIEDNNRQNQDQQNQPQPIDNAFRLRIARELATLHNCTIDQLFLPQNVEILGYETRAWLVRNGYPADMDISGVQNLGGETRRMLSDRMWRELSTPAADERRLQGMASRDEGEPARMWVLGLVGDWCEREGLGRDYFFQDEQQEL